MVSTLKKDIHIYSAYGFFIIMTLLKVLGYTTMNKVYYIGAGVAGISWLVSMATADYKLKDYLKCLAIFVVPVICFVFNHTLAMIMLAMALCLLKDIEVDKVIRYMAIVWLTIILTAFAGTLVGIIPMNVYVGEGAGRIVYRWFYYGQSQFQQAVMLAIIYYMVLRKNLTIIEGIILGALNYWAFVYSDSLTGLIIGYAFIAGFLLYRFTKQYDLLWKIFSVLMMVANVFLVVFSFVIAIMYNPDNVWSQRFDGFFTNRVHITHALFTEYPQSLFGQNIDNGIIGGVLDNAFADILMEFGIAMFALFIIMYAFTFRKLYKEKEYVKIMLCSAFLAAGMVEQLTRHCFQNFTLLFFAYVIWNRERQINDK